jgi:hypothetical protein
VAEFPDWNGRFPAHIIGMQSINWPIVVLVIFTLFVLEARVLPANQVKVVPVKSIVDVDLFIALLP